MLSALRGATQCNSVRAFSTTMPVAEPRDDPFSVNRNANQGRSPSQRQQQQQQQQPQSSTASLLSLDRPNRNLRRQAKEKNAAGAASRSNDMAQRMMDRFQSPTNPAIAERAQEQKVAQAYLREMPRRWQVGDVYAPHDLSPVEMAKFRKWANRTEDVVDLLSIRPQDMYKNFNIIKEYINPVGQILPSSQTGLRPRNQRKMAKMVRRAMGMGIHPSVHGHPEIIRDQFLNGIGR
jgi:small subunit ribosomal protein S18